MNIETDPRILKTVGEIVTDLAARRYSSIEARTHAQRLTAEDMLSAEEVYGAELAMPSEEMLRNVDAVQLVLSEPPEWSVRYPLWDVQLGRIDLTLELAVSDIGEPALRVELDEIHVL